jgi:hypothetical protein
LKTFAKGNDTNTPYRSTLQGIVMEALVKRRGANQRHASKQSCIPAADMLGAVGVEASIMSRELFDDI